MFSQADSSSILKSKNWSYSVNGQINSITGFEEYKWNHLRCILYLLLPDNWDEITGHSSEPVVSNLTSPGSTNRIICLPFQMHLNINLEDCKCILSHPRLLVVVVDENKQEVGTGFASLPLTPGQFNLRISTCAKSAVSVKDKLKSTFMSGSHYNSNERKSQLSNSIELSSSRENGIFRIKRPFFPQVNDSYGSVNVTLNVLSSSLLMDKLPVDPIEKVIEAFKRAKAKLAQLRQDIHEQTLKQEEIDSS